MVRDIRREMDLMMLMVSFDLRLHKVIPPNTQLVNVVIVYKVNRVTVPSIRQTPDDLVSKGDNSVVMRR